MADFPFACNIEGDYGYKVFVADDEDTIATLISKATDSIVGVLVPQFPPGTVLRARISGQPEPLPLDVTVRQAGLRAMEAIEIYRAG